MYQLGSYNQALCNLYADEKPHVKTTLHMIRSGTGDCMTIHKGKNGPMVLGFTQEADGTLSVYAWPFGQEENVKVLVIETDGTTRIP